MKDTSSINDNGSEDYDNNFETGEDEKTVKKQNKIIKRKSSKKKHSCTKDHPKISFDSLDDYNDHFRSVHVYTNPSNDAVLFMLKILSRSNLPVFLMAKIFTSRFLAVHIFLTIKSASKFDR